MPKVDKDFQEKALFIIRRDRQLKAVQREYERMSRLSYNLPEPLNTFEYIRPIISTAPYDALRGAVRALSNLENGLTIHPVSVLEALENKDDKTIEAATLANEWETTINWQIKRAEKRGRSLASDTVWSVAVYDEVIGKLIHLPTQFAAAPMGVREAPAYRFGDWALEIVDVKTVYPTYSQYGPESYLSVNLRTARQMLNLHGEAADFVKSKSKKNKLELDDPSNMWVDFDFVSHEEGRTMWASSGQDINDTSGEVILPTQSWLKSDGKQVPFLPIISSRGGTSVDTQPEYQIKPLLFPVLQAETWATTNIAGTIMMSQQLATAASATDVFIGPGSEDIPEDWTGPRRRLNLTLAQKYEQVRDAGMDEGMQQVFDRLEAAIQRATVADVLVTAQPISGEQAFASYDLQVKQALASLGDIKNVSESFIERYVETMLLITHYTGGKMTGYGKGSERYVIDSEDINPEAIYVEVELKGDVPSDRVQRVTAGSAMVRELGYSQKDAMKFLGETDPEGVMERARLEKLQDGDLQARIEVQMRKISGQYQEDVQAAAQALVEQQLAAAEQQAQQQGQLQAPTGETSLQSQAQTEAPAERPVRGPLANPAQGGEPPVIANPTQGEPL